MKKNPIETQWLNIKSKFKSNEYDLEEMDGLTAKLISHLAILTNHGYESIGGVKIDTYKDRVWGVVEKIGLLPEYIEEDETL